MFQFPRFPPQPKLRSCPSTGGCPIRTSSGHWLPAPHRRISSRGHVLHRPVTPRHPPCALLSGFPGFVCLQFVPSSWCARRVPTGLLHARNASGVTSSVLNVPHSRRGAAGVRTPDLRRARAALSQLSYGPLLVPGHHPPDVGAPGLEPGTSALSGPRSNHLSYAPGAVARHTGPRSVLCRRRSRPPNSHQSPGLPIAPVSLPGPAHASHVGSPRDQCPTPMLHRPGA